MSCNESAGRSIYNFGNGERRQQKEKLRGKIYGYA